MFVFLLNSVVNFSSVMDESTFAFTFLLAVTPVFSKSWQYLKKISQRSAAKPSSILFQLVLRKERINQLK